MDFGFSFLSSCEIIYREILHREHYNVGIRSRIACVMLHRFVLLIVFLLSACQPAAPVIPTVTPRAHPARSPQPTRAASPTKRTSPTPTATETWLPSQTPEPSATVIPSQTPFPDLDPAAWKTWPVVPDISERVSLIFQVGQSLGNDAHAFSAFGDCQSEPDVFLGIFDTDPDVISGLPPDLQETVAWFAGSFDRRSPTVKGGTTAGALLWAPWHQNEYTCTIYESPLQCELRIHKPAFVFIHVGTHYESRNQDYMRKVLDQVIDAGVVPILASKADDSELDEHVNAQYAQLAAEYAIPFWNFWAAVGELPNHGLYTRPDAAYQGDIYLIDTAVDIQRMSALLVLDRVRRAAMGQ
jgi:hypothetical protein